MESNVQYTHAPLHIFSSLHFFQLYCQIMLLLSLQKLANWNNKLKRLMPTRYKSTDAHLKQKISNVIYWRIFHFFNSIVWSKFLCNKSWFDCTANIFTAKKNKFFNLAFSGIWKDKIRIFYQIFGMDVMENNLILIKMSHRAPSQIYDVTASQLCAFSDFNFTWLFIFSS